MTSLKQLVDSYQPSQAAIACVRAAKVALLVGITGAGKDTIKRQLLELPGYQEIVSHTTRPPRFNNGVEEVEGKDYHFVSLDKAQRMIEQNEFIEAKLVHGTTIYGTSMSELEKASSAGAVAITDIDVQGVAEYKKLSPDVAAIFIIPPSFQSWQDRLRQRYQSPEEFADEWPKRRDSAIRELEYALSMPFFHFVLNDNVDDAIRVSHDIIQQDEGLVKEDSETRDIARQLVDDIKASS